MFDHVHHNLPTHIPCLCSSCTPLRHFAHENRDALQNAGALLGGRKGERLALAVLDSLSDAPASAGRLRRDLGAMRDLLTLEHVHDDMREEAGYFARIDPGDPIVEKLCLLADGLHDAIEEWDAMHEQADDVQIDERKAA